MSSHISFIIYLADAISNENIIHWSSIKYKRVTCSVLAADQYEMAHGFDIGALIKATLRKMLRSAIPLFYAQTQNLCTTA